MSLTKTIIRQKVKFSENERVDLPDLSAISDLQDAELGILLRTVVTDAGTNGAVLRGFTGSPAPGVSLNFNFDDIDSAAIDEDGNLITKDNVGVVQGLPLTDGTTNFIMLAYVPTDEATDSRRFIDSISGLETVQPTPTRVTKFHNFYVNQSGFIPSGVFLGAVRKFIPLYTVVCAGGDITGFTDSRPYFGDPATGESQAQLAGLPIVNIRTWLKDICARIKAVTGAATYVAPPTRTLNAVEAEVTAAQTSEIWATAHGSIDARLNADDARFAAQHNVAGGHTIITGTSLAVSGAISGASAAVTGAVTGASVGATGTVSGLTGSFGAGGVGTTGAVSAGTTVSAGTQSTAGLGNGGGFRLGIFGGGIGENSGNVFLIGPDGNFKVRMRNTGDNRYGLDFPQARFLFDVDNPLVNEDLTLRHSRNNVIMMDKGTINTNASGFITSLSATRVWNRNLGATFFNNTFTLPLRFAAHPSLCTIALSFETFAQSYAVFNAGTGADVTIFINNVDFRFQSQTGMKWNITIFGGPFTPVFPF